MRHLASILLFGFFLLGLARYSSPAQEWIHYSEADGLVGDSIVSIREDKKGYLWFVTEFSGASRYDGIRLQNYRSLNTPDSLVSDNIYCITADSVGNIWIGTDRGVSKFDGLYFQNFSETDGLAGNYITFIHEDDEGAIWLGTHNGVSRFDGKSFQNFDKENGLSDNNISFICTDRRGNLCFGTQKGPCKFDGDKFRALASPELEQPIQTVYEDAEENVWFGTESGAYVNRSKSTAVDGPLIEANIVLILEDQSGFLWFATEKKGLIKYDFSSGESRVYLGGRSIKSVVEDSRGDIWVGTDKGISRFDGAEFDDFSSLNGISLGFVWSILEDSDQNLWFGTDKGVWKYTIQNLQVLTVESGLAGNSVQTVLEDNEGNLWFGTVERGISLFDGDKHTHFGRADGLPDLAILNMVKDSRGDVWVGTSSGVCRHDGERFIQVKAEQALVDAVRAIVEDKATRDLWFATGNGVVHYDGRAFQSFNIEYGSDLIIDRSGNLWLGSWIDGLYRYDGKNWKHYTESDGLGGDRITWIIETHQGDIWFGFSGSSGRKGGVCRYDGQQFSVFTTENGLVDGAISVALEDNRGNLWFGTEDKGVMRYDIHPTEGTSRFVAMTEANGLISNKITTIFMDRSWNLWFGTDEGVSQYDGDNFQSIPLDLTLGSVHTIFEDTKGEMWFITTNDGVYKYIPSAKEIRPRVHIAQIEGDKIYHQADRIKIPITTKRVTIEYKGISFRTRPEELRYVYQLEGYDEKWSASTMATRIHYEGLEPGEYHFRVRAIDKDLHKTHPPASGTIVMFRPWYLTPQFFIGIILGGLGFIGGGGYLVVQLQQQRRTSARLREKLHKREEAERIQTTKMRSLRLLVAGVAHEMNNPIGVISSSNDTLIRAVPKIRAILSQVLGKDLEENEQLSKTLSLLEKTSNASDVASKRIGKIVANLRVFVGLDEAEWRTADIHEGIDTTISLMELGELCHIKVIKDYGSLPNIYCNPSSLNQVFMCMLRNSCEAIEGEGEIRVSTSVVGENITITISDTGAGIFPENLERIFDPGFTTKSVGVGMGLGLATSYKIIVDEHRGHIEVASELGKGTEFAITLPITMNERISG